MFEELPKRRASQKSIVLLIQISWKIDALAIVIVAEANQLTIVLHCEAVELFERMLEKGVPDDIGKARLGIVLLHVLVSFSFWLLCLRQLGQLGCLSIDAGNTIRSMSSTGTYIAR